MLRVLVALTLLGSAARADRPAEPPSEPDPRLAIKERGIVLQAGKRNLVVIVPTDKPLGRGVPADSKLADATIYFGDAKTLFLQKSAGISFESTREKRTIDDPRGLNFTFLVREGETYTLECTDQPSLENRTTALTAANAKTIAALGKASVRPLYFPFQPTLLARLPGTVTYLYVDNSTVRGSQEYRLFLGKRGAVKKIAVKESARDSQALVLVTAKGVLTVSLKGGSVTGVTWGSPKSPSPIDVVSINDNRDLVYRELGVYTRDRTGHPCDEL